MSSDAGGLVSDVSVSSPGGVALSAVADGLVVRRSTFVGETGAELGVFSGQPLVFTDSVAIGRGGNAVEVPSGRIELRNVTAISATGVAIKARRRAFPSTVVARNVIARGGGGDLLAEAATIDVAFSSFDPAKVATGPGGVVTLGAGNQDAGTTPPLFVDEVHQAPGSPTVDAGVADPLNGPTDFEGEPRVLGAAPDIGADELVPDAVPPAPAPVSDPPPPVPAPPAVAPRPVLPRDTTRPVFSRLKLRGRRLSFTLSEPATVRISFVRLVKGRPKGKPRSLKPLRLRAGAATVTRPALKPGRYRTTLDCTDAAGNRARRRTLDFTVR
jgi:hypothetical protein